MTPRPPAAPVPNSGAAAPSAPDALAARLARVFPDGRLTGADTRPFALAIERAAGDRVWDTAGREYLDFHLNFGAQVLGHGHPAVSAAIGRQIERGIAFGAVAPATIELAERIVAAVPAVERVKFMASGTEATHYALRIARALTGRDLVLRFEGGYHGHLDMVALSSRPAVPPERLDEPPDPRPVPDSGGIPDAVVDLSVVAPFNDAAAVEAILARSGERIAAVIVEPVQRFIAPQPGFLAALRELTRRHGAMLIFDEIVTGFRLGLGGAQEHYGVRPDLSVFGKIIGAGFSIAAVGGPAETMRAAFDPRSARPVQLSGTFAGHPVAAAGGVAVIEELAKPGAFEHLFELGAAVRARLENACRAEGVAAQVAGVGPMFHVSFAERPVANYRDGLREDRRLKKAVLDGLLRRGVHLPNGQAFVSLAHRPETIAALAERFADALGQARRTR